MQGQETAADEEGTPDNTGCHNEEMWLVLACCEQYDNSILPLEKRVLQAPLPTLAKT